MVKNSRSKIASKKVSLIEKRTRWILAISFFTLLLLVLIAALLSYPELRKKIAESTSGILYSPTGASTTVASSTFKTGSTGSTSSTTTTTAASSTTTGSATTTTSSGTASTSTSTTTAASSTTTGTSSTGTTSTPTSTTTTGTGTTTTGTGTTGTTTTPSSTTGGTTIVPTFPTLSVCGNGFVESGEICDPSYILKQLGYACTTSTFTTGSTTSTGVRFCITTGSTACKEYTPCVIRSAIPVCGNGKLEGVESCDDGNVVSGDGCSSTCSKETVTRYMFCSADSAYCADGSEVSKDSNNNCNWFPCADGSTPGICGDGVKNGPETCDKGDLGNGVLCDNSKNACAYCDVNCVSQVLQKQKMQACGEDLLYCADGSQVGRDTENNCEFKPCADGSTPTVNKIDQNQNNQEIPLDAVCGDGVVQLDLNEECDGNDLGQYTDQCSNYDGKYGAGKIKCGASCKLDIRDCQLQKKNTRYEIKGGEKLNPEEYATINSVVWGDVITYFIEGPNGESEEHTITVKTGRGPENNKRASVDLVFKSSEFLETFEDGDVKTLNVGGKDDKDDVIVGVENVNSDQGTSDITIALMSDAQIQEQQNAQDNVASSPQDQQFAGAGSTLQQIIQKGAPTSVSSKPASQNLYKVLFAVITVLAILVVFVFTRLAGTLHNQEYPQ